MMRRRTVPAVLALAAVAVLAVALAARMSPQTPAPLTAADVRATRDAPPAATLTPADTTGEHFSPVIQGRISMVDVQATVEAGPEPQRTVFASGRATAEWHEMNGRQRPDETRDEYWARVGISVVDECANTRGQQVTLFVNERALQVQLPPEACVDGVAIVEPGAGGTGGGSVTLVRVGDQLANIDRTGRVSNTDPVFAPLRAAIRAAGGP
jgi:hypothetical protein